MATEEVSFKHKSTYQVDPTKTASGVREFIQKELYADLRECMEAVNRVRPSQPLTFVAKMLLEGKEPEGAQSEGAPAGEAQHNVFDYLQKRVNAQLQQALVALVELEERPADPKAWVGNWLLEHPDE